MLRTTRPMPCAQRPNLRRPPRARCSTVWSRMTRPRMVTAGVAAVKQAPLSRRGPGRDRARATIVISKDDHDHHWIFRKKLGKRARDGSEVRGAVAQGREPFVGIERVEHSARGDVQSLRARATSRVTGEEDRLNRRATVMARLP